MLLLFLCCVMLPQPNGMKMNREWDSEGKKIIKRNLFVIYYYLFCTNSSKRKTYKFLFFCLKNFQNEQKKNMINVRNINICIWIYNKSRNHIHKQIFEAQDEAGERQTSIKWLIFLCFTGRLNHFFSIMFDVSSFYSRWEAEEMC